MFFVPTRSPRQVEHFSFLLDEFRRFDFHISKREERKKNKKNKIRTLPSLSLSDTSFNFYFFIIFILFILKWDPHVPFFFTS